MMHRNLDHAEKIQALSLVIKCLCEENDLNKDVVIEDFIYLIKMNISEQKNENN